MSGFSRAHANVKMPLPGHHTQSSKAGILSLHPRPLQHHRHMNKPSHPLNNHHHHNRYSHHLHRPPNICHHHHNPFHTLLKHTLPPTLNKCNHLPHLPTSPCQSEPHHHKAPIPSTNGHKHMPHNTAHDQLLHLLLRTHRTPSPLLTPPLVTLHHAHFPGMGTTSTWTRTQALQHTGKSHSP